MMYWSRYTRLGFEWADFYDAADRKIGTGLRNRSGLSWEVEACEPDGFVMRYAGIHADLNDALAAVGRVSQSMVEEVRA
jgi:hypothetical protein